MSGVYLSRLLRAVNLGFIDAGTCARVMVAHDDWCELKKGGSCNCNPDITIHTDDGSTFNVLADGSLRRRVN